jgi:hypothetical protein
MKMLWVKLLITMFLFRVDDGGGAGGSDNSGAEGNTEEAGGDSGPGGDETADLGADDIGDKDVADDEDEIRVSKEEAEFIKNAMKEKHTNDTFLGLQGKYPEMTRSDFDNIGKEIMKLPESERDFYNTPQGVELFYIKNKEPEGVNDEVHHGRGESPTIDNDELEAKFMSGDFTQDEYDLYMSQFR